MSCPVVGTTNDVLPPNHPDVDLSKDGQTCPVVGGNNPRVFLMSCRTPEAHVARKTAYPE